MFSIDVFTGQLIFAEAIKQQKRMKFPRKSKYSFRVGLVFDKNWEAFDYLFFSVVPYELWSHEII